MVGKSDESAEVYFFHEIGPDLFTAQRKNIFFLPKPIDRGNRFVYNVIMNQKVVKRN